MTKRRIGYAVWLGMAAILYFFENHTGTRIVLISTLIAPLIPGLRSAFFTADTDGKREAPEPITLRSFDQREAEEPGDVRPYVPGDPVRRIHWKLSAKKDELLLREMTPEEENEEQEAETTALPPPDKGADRSRNRTHVTLLALAAVLLLCLILLAAIPEARLGAQALCNRLYRASEATNAYTYTYFPVPEEQHVTLAALLTGFAACCLAAIVCLTRSRVMTLAIGSACALCQAYFGLSFPAWVHVPLFVLFSLLMLRRPWRRADLTRCGVWLLIVCLGVALVWPGVDAPTEAASEEVRDWLSQAAQDIMGSFSETPPGETETRRVHSLGLRTGAEEARADREYRLVTVKEEQIAMPHWVDVLKIILGLMLAIAVVSLPFAPFLLLNARKKNARALRESFAADDVSKAVRAIFGQVIQRLKEMGHEPENLLYKDWDRTLPEGLPEGYATRFAQCAADFEEATYSEHKLAEEQRGRALALLAETEAALRQNAFRKKHI